jgi:hypothetical protein
MKLLVFVGLCLPAVICGFAPVSAEAQMTAAASIARAEDDTPALPEDPAAVIAVVGQSEILWGDLEPKVDGQLNQTLERLGREYPESELAFARKQLARAALRQAIQIKMMREAFLLDQVAAESAEKRREVSDMMQKKAREMFFEIELKRLKKRFETEDLTELDRKMREQGVSLRARQREFTDMMLGQLFMQSKVEKDPRVTIAEINARYAKQIERFRHGPKARWEQLSVLFENHPSRESAEAAIKDMGREAYYGGSMQGVARQRSEEPYASDGGLHDWTSQGSLASKPLDEAIFSLPLNKMSEIIEDEQGLHIIRVLERKPAGVTPLANVQEEIREQLKQEKMAAAQERMLEQMRRRVPVWSLYPDDMPHAKPLRPKRVAGRDNQPRR